MASFLTMDCVSDHAPWIISLFDQPRGTNKRFMFFNTWFQHDNYLQLVEQFWVHSVEGTKQFRKELKMLKGPLNDLNKKQFGHISTRLKEAQLKFHDNFSF